MFDVSDLRAAYGRIPILNGVSFEVAEAEIVGILGHNGMGKTTLMRTLMGFIPATAGRIAIRAEQALAPARFDVGRGHEVHGATARRLGPARRDRHRARTVRS